MKAQKRVKVVVWVCRACGNYYAASSAGDLSTQLQTTKRDKPQVPRSRCPTPACASQERDREPVTVHV